MDREYLMLVMDIIKNGVNKSDRTGTGTRSLFGKHIEFDTKLGTKFPLLTSKKMYFKGIFKELMFFLRGDTDLRTLVNDGVNIWVGDAYKRYESLNNKSVSLKEFIELIKTDDNFNAQYGDLGPIYGHQWNNFNGVNQIDELIHTLKNNPNSRRMMVSAWNVSELGDMVLPPCHYGFQVYTRPLNDYEKRRSGCELGLSLKWDQRSVDTCLGLPFNIASYAILLHLLAKHVNMVPDKLIGHFGDTHIYKDHIDTFINHQLHAPIYELSSFEVKTTKADIRDYTLDDVKLVNYKSSPKIKYNLSN